MHGQIVESLELAVLRAVVQHAECRRPIFWPETLQPIFLRGRDTMPPPFDLCELGPESEVRTNVDSALQPY